MDFYGYSSEMKILNGFSRVINEHKSRGKRAVLECPVFRVEGGLL